jgi:hypothetical protein
MFKWSSLSNASFDNRVFNVNRNKSIVLHFDCNADNFYDVFSSK